MSEVNEAFSPPVLVETPSGVTVRFRRMQMDDWAELQAQIVAERLKVESARLNAEISDWQERSAARLHVQAVIEEQTSLMRLMWECENQAKMVIRLLKYALLDVSQEADAKKIPPVLQVGAAQRIIHQPVVKPNPQQPTETEEGSGDGGPAESPPTHNGPALPETSAEPSPVSIPAA